MSNEELKPDELDELNEMIAEWSKDFDGSLDDLKEIQSAMRNAYQLGRNHIALRLLPSSAEEMAKKYERIENEMFNDFLTEDERHSLVLPTKRRQEFRVETMRRFLSLDFVKGK